ncbi:MAG: type 1 glutamine amidotransferase [Bdellovibrio sp.]|nr:type 1 glutamine amidotransferase [Methylotenera sp.]
MKSIIIFRFLEREGAGYLGDFLNAQNIPWQLHEIDEGKPAPASILGYSGVVLMGGPMSVNDDLPWIAPILALIREAIDNDIPVLGHCLGGQFISKALGATITQNTVKEIGWGEVIVSQNAAAKTWFGSIQSFNAFHWHGETFSLPEGATHLLASPYCQHQAWSIGKHLAFQTHIEMTAEMVQKWCEEGAQELSESAASPALQQAEAMQQELPLHLFFLQKVAKQVYTQWIKGLV